MLELGKLLAYYAPVVKLPLIVQDLQGDIHYIETQASNGLELFYWDKIQIAPGEAGYLITDEFLCFGKVRTKDGRFDLLLGPCIDAPCDLQKAHNIRLVLPIYTGSDIELRDSLNMLQFRELEDFLHGLNLLQYLVNGSNVSAAVVDPPHPVKPSDPTEKFGELFFNGAEQWETQILDCIRYGKANEAKELLKNDFFSYLYTGRISGDALYGLRCSVVSMISLASRAAIKGGLHYTTGAALAEQYYQKLPKVETFIACAAILREALEDFAERVAELTIESGTSELVRSVAADITGHLYEPITVDQIAQRLRMNRSFLSHQFSQQTGRKLSAYIQELKIREAVRLMRSGQYTCEQVADLLGYSSAPQFSAVFKRVTGYPPAQFMKMQTG